MIFKHLRISMLGVFLILSACAHHQELPFETIKTLYQGQDANNSLILRQTPFFLTHNSASTYNRIGRPSARFDDQGNEQIYVNTEHPVIYYLKRHFTTSKGQYTNLIYRVHFPKVPFSLIPFHLTAGENVGLMVVITLDAVQRPVLVTTVGTCGCYQSIVPTSFLPRDALPLKWQDKPVNVYGEILPSRLNFKNVENPSLLIHIRPNVHRVMDLEIVDKQEIKKSRHFMIIPAALAPMQELESIPINSGTTSFFYNKGVLKGHVKGSVKPWESLFMSLLSLDFFVGTDKVYADRKETGNPFYTSIKPWNRNTSDMWDFATFLKFWGWRL
ncbi:MAG: hypothetical protein JRF17_11750 [Deltaproteobacteria bacterium]|nr:hypothetical protein [Deltaproteobacteria bacterium]